MNNLNYRFIRKWIEQGSPDFDVIAEMVSIYPLNLIKVIKGKISADVETKTRLARVLDCNVEDIFPIKEDK
jgi:DNA-binding XRE family transcriptional regulator